MKIDLDSPELYFNRELSWLEFNSRVLEEASDSSTPLLERFRFAAITCSNLDEFFMVRVAARKNDLPSGASYSADPLLGALSDRAHKMVHGLYQLIGNELLP